MRQQVISSLRPFVLFLSPLVIAAGCPQTEQQAPPAPEASVEATPTAQEVETVSDREQAGEGDVAESASADDSEDGDASTEAEASQDEAEPEEQIELTDVSSMKELVECMKEAGVVIYGAVTCPFCTRLADSFGGSEVVSPIYVECTEDGERCRSEMKGRGVPEIQVRGELYRGSREPAEMGRAVGCNLVE